MVQVWKPIEKMVIGEPIWVLKYDVYFSPDGNFCSPEDEGSVKFTSCHGWYSSEEDALKVMKHFPSPNSYRTEKVYKREII